MLFAGVAELADAQDLGSCAPGVQVQLLSPAPLELSIVDTKISAIFLYICINTANINDL